MIRVLLVAPSPALRAGLRSLLSTDPELRVVGERSGWGATDQEENEADVMIMTSASFVSFAEDTIHGQLSTPVLFLQDEPLAPQWIINATTGWGILPLETSAGELCAAVRALAEGLIVGTRALLFHTADGEETPRGPLTDREAEVLGWLAKGLANKQIAAALGISEHTVKFHISSIYTKLNATNRTQAVREGLRNGWILL